MLLEGRDYIMALINCPECNREISDRAESCPHCGYPIQESVAIKQNKTETYSVKLLENRDKVRVIKIIREVFGYGLKESKDIVDKSPVILATNLSKEEAEEIAQPFYNNLFNVEIYNNNNIVDMNLKPQPPKNQYNSSEPLYSNNSEQTNRPYTMTYNSANQKPKIGALGIIIIIIILLGIIGSITCCEADHDDGKCDICGKTSVYSGEDEEYCEEHLMDATECYIEQSEK
jgi:ribosomal protein L7/L12